MKYSNKPSLIPSTLYPEDVKALAHFLGRYNHVLLKVEESRITLRAIGVRHFHEVVIRSAGVEEFEA
jgi:hypothetical protein